MAVRYHRKVKSNEGGHINISKSGLSHSQKIGKFTFNSRGTMSYNSSIKGLSFRCNVLFGVVGFIPFYYLTKATIFVFFKLPFRLIAFLIKQPINLVKFLLKKKKDE